MRDARVIREWKILKIIVKDTKKYGIIYYHTHTRYIQHPGKIANKRLQDLSYIFCSRTMGILFSTTMKNSRSGKMLFFPIFSFNVTFKHNVDRNLLKPSITFEILWLHDYKTLVNITQTLEHVHLGKYPITFHLHQYNTDTCVWHLMPQTNFQTSH